MRISDWSSDVCSSDLPSLDVDKHDVANAPPVIDSGALDFDLGSFDATPAPTVAAAEPVAHDASATLDFDLGDFDVGANASASPAAEPAAETPIEEFDFGRSEGRRGGKEWVRTCRSRWCPDP